LGGVSNKRGGNFLFTISLFLKESEILEKSSVNESLKDSLLSSPLSDKIFGLSVQEVQEEIKKQKLKMTSPEITDRIHESVIIFSH
jgi:hypothetical protein